MFLRYPFSRPAYRYQDRNEPQGRGLDMLRCPVADYLAGQDAADLCVNTWCNLDFPLARMWGGELERHGTLAGGAKQCDFRFRAPGQKSEKARARGSAVKFISCVGAVPDVLCGPSARRYSARREPRRRSRGL